MDYDIAIQYELCLGCHSCELACAVAHSDSKNLRGAIGETSPAARIFVEAAPPYKLPMTCRHCKDAPCVDACSSGAMRSDGSGLVSNAAGTCVGCWMCVMVCPYGVVRPDYRLKQAVKCNRECMGCAAIPACVQACPTGALTFVSGENWTKERRVGYIKGFRTTQI